jgi:hypothetical protein
VTSPAASGPAGSEFEGQVGAHYLLTMLVGAEPRGLPATTIDRVEFQRAESGRPLDDVIIHAHDLLGAPAVLEVQVKRSLSFAPADPVFRDVMKQVAKATRRSDFWESRCELAIATAMTSRKIDGAYQDVLTWARRLGSATVFFEHLGRKGFASEDMRIFVATVRNHLEECGVSNDEETTWRLLRKLWILTFDFTAEGSASEALAKERAVRALHPDCSAQAATMWRTLIELAIRFAAAAGESSVAELTAELTKSSFRLSGQRRFATARAVISESSRNALGDIGDRVGDVTLGRIDRLAEIRAALDRGRYLEIAGDAGVGKSGLLKHLAEQIATEAGVIVLSPDRTPPRGWLAMRAELGFDGSARELLADIAGDGGAAIFVDNLDQFTLDERRTVIDLVRAASDVPGVALVATARRNFGTEEPSWLPAPALERLGHAGPIVVGELHEAEIDELRVAAPKLADLLSNSHPAREVIRNLYRLGRLAERPAGEPAPRTEIDMAMQWWHSADGKLDEDHRDRSRLLRALAYEALSGPHPVDVSDRPSPAVDQLVASETLRDLGADRVTFRHDVLREWAIANLLGSEFGELERLPLDRPASASFARGIELCARIALERSGDSAKWKAILDRLSQTEVHGSWRRAALLALVRSEISFQLLTRVASHLLLDDGAMLRELIRTTMAVDSAPAAQFLTALGLDATNIPVSLNVPSGPSWHRLIRWLLALGTELPAGAIPDVVDFYTAWSSGMIGMDALTPTLLKWLHDWLIEIESSRDGEQISNRWEPFGGRIPHDRIRELESSLRSGFLLFCHRTPDLAVDYLRGLKGRRHNESVVEGILKFRGSLAQAAPAELADLTAAALVRNKNPMRERGGYDEIDGAFGFLDHEFLPASPAQGPFLELLTHAPQHGLPLIRQLVGHAVAFDSDGKLDGSNGVTIPFPEGKRFFPRIETYFWSRSGDYYCVNSALMALEAWAHMRIERGDDVHAVLSDVLGASQAPAAYLLVAVDLLLSHWPKTLEAVVPFLASPELLSLDREREVHDYRQSSDIFALSGIQKEPAGTATLSSLRSRPSRRYVLEKLLGFYASIAPTELRNRLAGLLNEEAARLGAPNVEADMRDPALMVRHALNLIDPANWKDARITLADESTTDVREYVAPEAEVRHFDALQAKHAQHFADAGMEARISLAIDDPSKSTPDLPKAALEWAQRQPDHNDQSEGDYVMNMRSHALVAAAMIAMRDGDSAFRSEHRSWADGVFASVLQQSAQSGHGSRSGLRFNSPAIAFAGMVHVLKDGVRPGDMRALLEAAANPAAAAGLAAVAEQLATIDERLPRALLRCAFAAAVRLRRRWDATKEETARDTEKYRVRCEAAVAAELSWLFGEAPEPSWPTWPLANPQRRRPLRLPGGASVDVRATPPAKREDEYTDHKAAAFWLNSYRRLFDPTTRPWILDIVRTYSDWTACANGAGLAVSEDLSGKPWEWNGAYFCALANYLPALTPAEVDELVLEPIRSFPERLFLDALATFIPNVDDVFFNDRGLSSETAVHVRSALAEGLQATGQWRNMVRRPSTSIEMHLGPAAAAVFFNSQGFGQPAAAYLNSKGIDRLGPFLPLLERLASNAPSPFVAFVTLNLLEVAPRTEHATLLVSAAKACVATFADDSDFWINYGIGRRVSALIDTILVKSNALFGTHSSLRPDVHAVLAAMVRVGVPEAARTEREIEAASSGRRED